MRSSQLINIFFVVFIVLVGFGLIMPLMPFYVARYGGSELLVGLLVASYAMAQFIGAPLVGRLSDQRGRRPLLAASMAGTVLGFLLIGLVLGPFGVGYLDDYYPFLRYVTLEDPKAAEPLAELGVVFLLFLLGMELSLSRLWQLRRYVLGVGLVQVAVCIVVITAVATWVFA